MNRRTTATTIVNRQARHHYQVGKSLTAGLVLTGREVSCLRQRQLSLRGSFINFKDEAVWLQNLQLFPSASQGSQALESRPIKLLLTKAQIKQLRQRLQHKGSTIIVLKIILGKYIKIEIAPAIGRRKYDKREVLKKRAANRQARRTLKGK